MNCTSARRSFLRDLTCDEVTTERPEVVPHLHGLGLVLTAAGVILGGSPLENYLTCGSYFMYAQT